MGEIPARPLLLPWPSSSPSCLSFPICKVGIRSQCERRRPVTWQELAPSAPCPPLTSALLPPSPGASGCPLLHAGDGAPPYGGQNLGRSRAGGAQPTLVSARRKLSRPSSLSWRPWPGCPSPRANPFHTSVGCQVSRGGGGGGSLGWGHGFQSHVRRELAVWPWSAHLPSRSFVSLSVHDQAQ